MTIRPELYQRILRLLAEFKDLTHKVLAARLGKSSVYYLLSKRDRAPIDEEEFKETLAGLSVRPAHAALTAGWIETMDSLEQEDVLAPEERDEVELALFRETQARRALYVELARRLRDLPPLEGYPEPGHLEPLRFFARQQLALLKELKTEEERLAVIHECREYQHWALMEAVAEESEEAASRSVEESAFWSQLAVEIAEHVRGPEEWLRRVWGYAASCRPNTLRVAGELDLADAGLQEAKRSWLAGSDPARVLDPGRLLDLEASLRRAQRRFAEALDRLADAGPISHNPARVLLKRAFTLEVLGDYEQAIEALREAEPLVNRHANPRLYYMLRHNLAVCYTHLDRYLEAKELLREVQEIVIARRDENEIPRVNGLRGRIAAGLGRSRDARALLELALRQFARKKMWYDVAIVLMEVAVLLLREGNKSAVKEITPKLTEVFASRKVHREALGALQLFREAAESETADEELARRVLRFLFRARHDQGLLFKS